MVVISRRCYALTAGFLALGGIIACVQTSPPPGSIVLLCGYRHTSESGIDTEFGRIWKTWGPEIQYEIGGLRADVENLLDLRDIVTRKTQSINGHPFKVLMQRQDKMTVIYQDANFEARNVKSDEDVEEVLRMLMTYCSDRWKSVAPMNEC